MNTAQKSKAPAIDSCVAILDLLASSAYALSLSEIAEGTGLAPASAHRIVNTMVDHQLISLDHSRKKSYCIGSKIFQIASTIYNKQSLIPLFFPIAEILKNEIHKTVFLSVPIGNKIVVISKLDYSQNLAFDLHIGQTMPMHISASGKAILSMRSSDFQNHYLKAENSALLSNPAESNQIRDDLSRAKRLGYALTHSEIGSDMSCIAAPILNLRNEPVAAISAALRAATISPQEARGISKNLIQAARQLSSRIL